MFESKGVKYALLPGYEGKLGVDTGQLGRVENVLGLPAFDSSVQAQRTGPIPARDLTPERQVVLRPFLVGTNAQPLTVKERQPDGTLRMTGPVWRAQVLDRLKEQGSRFPTNDEWEYACSGGARTLFRWGDEWPSIDWTPAERRGDVEWRDDLQPNAFGVEIAQNPWHLEYCAEPNILRGGDGGTAASVGAGREFVWFTLATAYRFPFTGRLVQGPLRQPQLRQAMSLPDELWR